MPKSSRTLKVLHVEDSKSDAALLAMHLTEANYNLVAQTVETAEAMRRALQINQWDIILCDYSLPTFNALAALALIKEMKLDIPFIIISGTIGEELAVEAMRKGAHDYLMKDNLTRLVPTIERELQEADNRRARRQAEQDLRSSHGRLEQTLVELQRKSDEVSRMTQQLWQSSKLATMGELSAGVAHELNNPLGTLALRAESLLEQFAADDPKRRAVEIIAQEVERMGRLVGNLLQFSRRTHQQTSTVDVRDEIESSLELIEYHLRSHRIEVIREFAANLPTIQADREQVHQICLNLLTNAGDAMPAGGKLIVRVTRGSLDGVEAVQMEFVDHGTGIAPVDLERIWEPFFTTKPEGKGTGLGLAICRRIVEEHHGSIAIESRLGQGTTVRILFPATNDPPFQSEPDR